VWWIQLSYLTDKKKRPCFYYIYVPADGISSRGLIYCYGQLHRLRPTLKKAEYLRFRFGTGRPAVPKRVGRSMENWRLELNEDKQPTYNVILGRVRVTIGAVEKQWVLHNLSCVFAALGIQHARRMRHIVICGLPRSKMFFHICHKCRNFLKIVIEHKICSDFLCTSNVLRTYIGPCIIVIAEE